MNDDFWATNVSDKPSERTPYMILREQATALSKKTKDVVQADVKTEQIHERIEYELLIYAAVLGLRVSILRVVSEGGSAYPATMSGRYVKKLLTCKNESEFVRHLKAILGSREVTEAVHRLQADSEASGLQFYLVEDGEVVGETGSLRAAKELACRMIGQGGLIDIHELGKGSVGNYLWLDDQDEPDYHEVTPVQNGAVQQAQPLPT